MRILVTGATAIQLGTVNFYNPTVSMKILDDLPAAITQLGEHRVRDVVGTLKSKSPTPPSPAVNGGLERCELDASGRCVRARPCYADYRTDLDDDCLGEIEERAWSSPIYVRPR